MDIGILYESKEWSSYQLQKEIEKLGIKADLIYMEDDIKLEHISKYKMLVSRVFASAIFRNHHKALKQMEKVIDIVEKNNILMINSAKAHLYEIDKQLSTNVLRDNNISVPDVYGVFTKKELLYFNKEIEYPCIIKPNCGGRTNATFIINNREELYQKVTQAPDIKYIMQKYIYPEYGFITRVEVIDNECKSILKRSVVKNGLSAYNLGSTYSCYDDCREEIKTTAIKAMNILEIECGSMDIAENSSGYYIFDVNSVSNASQDNKEDFKFDLIKETALYIVDKYKQIKN